MDRDNLILEAIHLFKTRAKVWLYDWIEDVDRWMEKAESYVERPKDLHSPLVDTFKTQVGQKENGMKRLMVLVVALALIGGCCTSPNNSSKNFGNCVAKVIGPVKSILCPPNQAQVDQAAAAATFLASFLGTDYTAQIAAARQIFLDVAAKVCVGLDQLQTALDTFDGAALVVREQAKMTGKAQVFIPDVSALRVAVKK